MLEVWAMAIQNFVVKVVHWLPHCQEIQTGNYSIEDWEL